MRGEIILTDATTAEMVKLMENTYRDVNIAIANEFARLADRFGVDVWEAIALANRHPRVRILNPGPGVGGHCISVDPWFLVEAAPDLTPADPHRARRSTTASRILWLSWCGARWATTWTASASPRWAWPTSRMWTTCAKARPLKSATLLAQAGAVVSAYEPFKPEAVNRRACTTVPTLAEAVEDADVLLLLVGHTQLRELDPVGC